MRIDVVPAAHGDCLLIHGEVEGANTLAMIDGGPPETWEATVLPALVDCQGDDGVITIDVIIVTHVDDDHIGGVLCLLREMKRDRDGGRERRFKVADLWYNAPGHRPVLPAALLDEPFEVGTSAADVTSDWDVALEPSTQASSFEQGEELLTLARELGIPVNKAFGGARITEGSTPTECDLGYAVQVLGPMQKAVDALDRAHRRWEGTEVDAGALTITDRSVPNLSSVVLLLDDGRRTVLLGADARGDKVIEALERARPQAGGTRSVAVLKVPHHGSARNVDERFFSVLKAETYVFCGNGRHGNPGRATVESVLANADPDGRLVFTSPLATIDAAIREERERQRERCRRAKRAEPPAWTPEADGLAHIVSARNPGIDLVEGEGDPIKV